MKSSKGRIIRDLAVRLANVSPMFGQFGQRLGYRLRPSQMARFVLPNANMTHLISSYTAAYSLFNEDEY